MQHKLYYCSTDHLNLLQYCSTDQLNLLIQLFFFNSCLCKRFFAKQAIPIKHLSKYIDVSVLKIAKIPKNTITNGDDPKWKQF